MKKHLFFIATAFAMLSLNAQTFFGGAQVKIKSGTLVYVGGDAKFTDYGSTAQKVSNEGKVKVAGEFKNDSEANAFVNEFVDTPVAGEMKYGQLIIENDGTDDKASGKMTSVVKKPTDGKFAYLPLALPYSGVSTNSIVKELFQAEPSNYYNYNGGGAFSDTRYKSPLFFFNNESYTVDDLEKTADIVPTRYYMVNTKYTNGTYGAGEKASLTGVPNNKKEDITLKKYHVATNMGINKYGEAYGSYINDWIVTEPQGWTNYNKASGKVVKVSNDTKYGDNIFQFGNPYTSNIDLEKGFFANISGKYSVMQRTATTFNEGVKDGQKPSNITLTVYYTSDGTGNKNAFLVRPFQSFQVKMIDEASDYKFSFSDALKTFSLEADAANVMYNKRANKPVVNQVELNLVKNNTLLGSTYVVASDIYKASKKGEGIEVYDQGLKDNTLGIYTLQEAKDGSIEEALVNEKAYINGVNSNYVGKPIHLVVQNGNGQYTIKANLNKDLANSGKSFWFEDKKEGKVLKVSKDFAYTVNVQGTDKDRFVLYWAQKPAKVSDNNIAKEATSSATQVYQDTDNQYKVRFGNDVKNPSVFVYNISGQLVNVARNVSTSSDYTVPVNANATVYIVKIVGANGKVITKKIVK